MATKIVLPNGNLTCNETMNTVDLVPGKGVVCRDSLRKIVAWIPVADQVKANTVLKLMSDFARAGRWGVQPCWKFLDEETTTKQ
jgi:hypothetical protein